METETEIVPPGTLTSARFVEIVFPSQTNHYGTLFGGQALALMDKAAFVVGSRYSRRSVVTASTEQIDFHVPVKQGELVELIADLVHAGTTSMTVEVKLYAEALITGRRRLATKGRFVLVALDEDGHPTKVPPMPAPSENQE